MGCWTTSESPKCHLLALAQALTLDSKTRDGVSSLLGGTNPPRRARVGQGPGSHRALLAVLLQPLGTSHAAANGSGNRNRLLWWGREPALHCSSSSPSCEGCSGSREQPGQAGGGLACVFHSKPLQLIAAYKAEQVCDILLFASGEQR